MDDFLSSRPQINAPRSGDAERRSSSAAATLPLGELKAEVRSPAGVVDPGRAPEVETVVVNGCVRRIHIHCKCGEEIILHCEYPQ